MTSNSLADFWQWYESADEHERREFQPGNDFGREKYPEPNWPEWAVVDSGSAALVRAWPRGIDDPGGRALVGVDRPALGQRVAEYQRAYANWRDRQ